MYEREYHKLVNTLKILTKEVGMKLLGNISINFEIIITTQLQ